MRRAHYLRPNAKCEVPHEAIWFDTETFLDRKPNGNIRHRLKFGWACYRRRRSGDNWTDPRWCRFRSADEFWSFVGQTVRPKTRCYLFCHNTNFDLPVLDTFNALILEGWTLKSAIIDAPPTILNFTKDAKRITILDTLNIFRMPLSQLGEMIGTPKYVMPDVKASTDEWDRYARQDVEVIMQACMQWWRFLKDNDLGNFSPTLAGQSLQTFRHRFMTTHILINDREAELTLARSSYLGGRCEAFRLGHIEGPIYVLDINSMYPAVMRDGLYPARFCGMTSSHAERAVERYRDTRCLVAKVEIETDVPAYPLVISNKLCFPLGRFMVSLAGPELIEAIKLGHVRAIHSVALYEPEPLFRDFVDYFYSERLRAREVGNASRSWMLKILMNSLYGKFGQRGIVWDELQRIDDLTTRCWVELDYETGAVTRYRQFCGMIQHQLGDSESRDSCPSIAAYVTSYARIKLWRLIAEAGRSNVFYCDTDSLMVNRDGYRRLSHYIDEIALGALKLEGIHPDAHIWGCKDYRLGVKEKHKGVKRSAVWISKDTVEQDRWSSLRGALRQGDLSLATTSKVRKTLKRIYTKGTLGPGGVVTPLVLSPDSAGPRF